MWDTPNIRKTIVDLDSNALEPTYVYILHCGNDLFYVGITNNFKNRLHDHVSGNGAGRTQENGVENVAVYWKCPTRVEAWLWEGYFTRALDDKRPSTFGIHRLRTLYRDGFPKIKEEVDERLRLVERQRLKPPPKYLIRNNLDV